MNSSNIISNILSSIIYHIQFKSGTATSQPSIDQQL